MISSTSLWFAAGVNVMIIYPPCKKRRIVQDKEHTIGESIRDPLLKGSNSLAYRELAHRPSKKSTRLL